MEKSDRAEKALYARWVETWRQAGAALAEQKQRELQHMTAEEALAAADAVLALADPSCVPRHRLETSGLVSQQARFHRKPVA